MVLEFVLVEESGKWELGFGFVDKYVWYVMIMVNGLKVSNEKMREKGGKWLGSAPLGS